MVRKLVSSKSFEKSFSKFVKGNNQLREKIEETLQLMEEDVFLPKLQTHKLSGKLYELLACSCGYDCRIIFSIKEQSNLEVIILIDIGTHDEVY